MPRPSPPLRRLPFLALVILGALLFATPASGEIYWTNFSGDSIGRAALDGTSADQEFIAGPPDPPINPYGVAFNSEYVYWANRAGSAPAGTIGRARLDGSEVDNEFITGGDNPSGVAIDATHIYWANSGVGATTIGRATLAGEEVDQSFIAGLDRPSGVTVAGGYIYWGEVPGDIGRATVSGDEIDTEFIENGAVEDIAVNNSHIFWTSGSSRIGRAEIDGSDPNEFFIPDGGDGTGGIDVNRNHIFWTNEFDDTIGRSNLDGTGVDETFIGGANGPTGIAVEQPPPPPTTGPPAPPAATAASLRLVKVIRNRKRGTAKLLVEVSGPGAIRLADSRKVKGVTRHANAAGTVRVPLVPKRKFRKRLLEKGRLTVLAKVTFMPVASPRITMSWRRPLIRKPKGRSAAG